MLHFLPGQIKGVLSFLLIVIHTIFLCTLLFLIAILKFVIPVKGWRTLCTRMLIAIAFTWVTCNTLILKLVHRIKWDVRGLESISRKSWYLVVSNHQSWVDILVLQTVFLRRIPFLKFFLKKELIWVPVMGLAWWALDFPFMKRYSGAFLKAHPHLKGKDIEITKKACEKFKTTPVSVMNFVEGTRFTQQKHKKQESPFVYLLKPKAGGIAFVLAAMGECLESLLDVTIAYPHGVKSFWGFLCGEVPEIWVQVESIPVTQEILGDYFNDDAYRDRFQNWVNGLWRKKDETLKTVLGDG